MDKVKAAAASLLDHTGKKDTTVHETVAPAVKHETNTKTQTEQLHPVTDKTTHQDHYHTTVQPVKDHQVLPEQHHHRVTEGTAQEFKHGDHNSVKASVAQEAAQFKHTHTEAPTVQGKTTSAPTVVGENVHHHVHETIQPVLERQTVEPHVVHTTVPLSETHHAAPRHHTASTLPAVSLDEFKTSGGVLEGREVRHDKFDGAPRYNGVSGNSQRFESATDGTSAGTTGTTGTGHTHAGHTHTGHTHA